MKDERRGGRRTRDRAACRARPLFRFFAEGGGSASAPRWMRWGPGGHFFVSGGLLLAASLILKAVPEEALSIDDAE